MTPPCIRPAAPQDTASIVRLFQGAFPPELLEISIYGCPGVRSFVKRQIEVPNQLSDTVYLVAAEGSSLCGCAEFRRLRDSLFLNYIAVGERVRGRGLGMKLVADAAARYATPATASIGLDVLESNSPARSWYARIDRKK